MAYKMKGFSGFKDSPVKQTSKDAWYLPENVNKGVDAIKKKNLAMAKRLNPEVFTEKPPKSLNTQGSKGIPKGQNFERYAKDKHQSPKQKFDARQASKQKGKEFVKGLKTKGDLVSKKPTEYTRVTKTGKPAGFTKQQKVLSKIDKATKGKFNKQIVKAGSSKLANTKLTKQVLKKGLSRAIPGVGTVLMAADVLKHGVQNVIKGKAKIPKGYYEKGGAGYQKRDYSKKK